VKNANLVSTWLSLLCLCCALVATTGCKRQSAPEKPAAYKTVADYFPIKIGDKTVRMQLAVLPAEMQRGLMGRRDLAEDQGMIFVYQKPSRMSFYMRNTPTPLDIGYFTADGVLQEIYPMYPFDETTVSSKSTQIQFALEMNQGWYKANAVRPGAKLDLTKLTEAMKARGFELRAFGLAP
jgi:uncharacterized protein